jgi:hypothetical protein
MPSSSKIAFLDAYVWSSRTHTFDQQNILLYNGVWVGSGYLPDEDSDATCHSFPKCFVLPVIGDLEDVLTWWHFERGHPIEQLIPFISPVGKRRFGLTSTPSFSIYEKMATSFRCRAVVDSGQLTLLLP